MPRVGTWTADLAVDALAAPTGGVELLAHDGALRLVGTTVRSGLAAGAATLRAVGGAGGLGRDIRAQSYRLLPLRVPVGDVLTAATARDDVVDVLRVGTAVLAAMAVTHEHRAPAERGAGPERHLHEVGEPDDRRHCERTALGVELGVGRVHHLRLLLENQHDRAPHGDDAQRLIGGVQDERLCHAATPALVGRALAAEVTAGPVETPYTSAGTRPRHSARAHGRDRRTPSADGTAGRRGQERAGTATGATSRAAPVAPPGSGRRPRGRGARARLAPRPRAMPRASHGSPAPGSCCPARSPSPLAHNRPAPRHPTAAAPTRGPSAPRSRLPTRDGAEGRLPRWMIFHLMPSASIGPRPTTASMARRRPSPRSCISGNPNHPRRKPACCVAWRG